MIIKNIAAAKLKNKLLAALEEIEDDIMHIQRYQDGSILGWWINNEVEIQFGTSKPHIIGSHIINVPAVRHGGQQIDSIKLTTLSLVDGTYKHRTIVSSYEILNARLKDVFSQVAVIKSAVSRLKVGKEMLHDAQARACGVCFKGTSFRFLPSVCGNGSIFFIPKLLKKVSDLCQIAETEATHRLYNCSILPATFQLVGHLQGLLVGAGQNSSSPFDLDFCINE